MKICEIGCGDKRVFPNSIAIDIRKNKVIDIVGDAKSLPFKNECFDHVYASHVIEHFQHNEIDSLVNEWVSVLKKGGKIEIRCPDLRARAFIFSILGREQDIINIYGEQNYPYNFHKTGFSYKILKQMLSNIGIVHIRRQRDNRWGFPFIPSDLHIYGYKFLSEEEK